MSIELLFLKKIVNYTCNMKSSNLLYHKIFHKINYLFLNKTIRIEHLILYY